MTVWAFIDESGDPNLAMQADGHTHFAIGGIVVRDEDLLATRTAVEAVRRRYFQTGQIKSQSVGPNLPRRLKILGALQQTGIRVLGIVVDKRRLAMTSGLRFRQPFMKHVSRFVYERLGRAYPSLCIRADTHGRPQFMQGFRAYMAKHFAQLGLFADAPRLEHVRSDDEVLVQAADFVAGSLRIAFVEETSEDEAGQILSALHTRSLGIHEWPPAMRGRAAIPSSSEERADLDAVVRHAAERSAYTFLEGAADKEDEQTLMQVEVLTELFAALRFGESGYVSGDALAERLRERGFNECSREAVRRSIITSLRDREVLIVSSARGYSLASTVGDVETYLQRMEDVVRPILRRVHRMDDTIKRASVGDIALLKSERFGYLHDLLELHQQFELTYRSTVTEAGS